MNPAKAKQKLVAVIKPLAVRKAEFIIRSFAYVQELGGPMAAKATLFSVPGRGAKIKFLQTFPGIGPKYARNIMVRTVLKSEPRGDDSIEI